MSSILYIFSENFLEGEDSLGGAVLRLRRGVYRGPGADCASGALEKRSRPAQKGRPALVTVKEMGQGATSAFSWAQASASAEAWNTWVSPLAMVSKRAVTPERRVSEVMASN